MSDFTLPPEHGPVVIVEDGGGLVTEYEAAFWRYYAQNRRVIIKGSCRSACILALGEPNVCIYRSAVVKAHMAYEQRTGVLRPDVTNQMMKYLPWRVSAQLKGRLGVNYTTLTGSQLIQLGVSECPSRI